MAVIYALLRVRLNNVQNVFVHQKINHRRNRPHFSANGPFLLLPLALKWSLFILSAMVIVPCFKAKGVSAASLTLEIPTNPLTLDIAPSESGTFSKSNPATIKISTNALAGYSLSIKAKTGSDLTNTSTSDKITSITEKVAENNFNSNSTYNNKYGFAFGKSGSIGTLYSGVNTVIDTTDGPNTENNAYDIVLGARVSNTIAAVQYSNTFVVMASANPVPYTIVYDKNATDEVSNMPTGGEKTAEAETFSLPENKPNRKEYAFIGWCDTEPKLQSDSNIETCSEGTFYKPGDDFTLKEKNEKITLFAVWAKPEQIMQNWNGCNVLGSEEAVTLVDLRDNNIYTAAKLLDGKCWMTKNLRIGNNQAEIILIAEDSDLDEGSFTLPRGDNTIGTENGGGWDRYDTPYIYIEPVFDGGYYSWFAATVGEGTSKMESGETEHSICPKGWRLPTSAETLDLIDKYDTTTFYQAPANFDFTGNCDKGGCPRSQNTGGYFWTSTAASSIGARILRIYPTKLDNESPPFTKEIGNSVRCIARQ